MLDGPDSHFRIASDSGVGTPRSTLVLDSALSFMAGDGGIHEALLLVEVDTKGDAAAVYLLPLTALHSGVEYRLVGIDTTTAQQNSRRSVVCPLLGAPTSRWRPVSSG